MKDPQACLRLLRRTNYRPTYPTITLWREALLEGRCARMDIGDGVRREGFILRSLFYVLLDRVPRCFPLARVRVEG